MNVKFINPFLDSTVNVLSTMAAVNPIPGKPFLKQQEETCGDVSGIIGLTGSARGSMAISFSTGSILQIVRNMLGEEHDSVDSDICDAVGELTNMVSGDARKRLEQEGLSITASLPTVVAGRDHVINHALRGPSIIIPFDTEKGPFYVDVCLAE
ncbi:MAG: chemotaxis protein CheX [Syntrophaceae bacterium]|nr:chemotaxis protein CheX [Syntrophaceae bacterium]